MHSDSVVLFFVHLRSASLQSARLEKVWSLVSHGLSQRQGVNGSANSQQNV